jgi:hypothetical protein
MEGDDGVGPDPDPIKKALLDAGIEVYRQSAEEIQIAERERIQIMDSYVRVRLDSPVRVQFKARLGRSRFPHESAEKLYARVRNAVGDAAGERGYLETSAQPVEDTDPVDRARVLEVWYEVTYEKEVGAPEDAIEEVRWALTVEKYVTE